MGQSDIIWLLKRNVIAKPDLQQLRHLRQNYKLLSVFIKIPSRSVSTAGPSDPIEVLESKEVVRWLVC
jgi:hypothetical protein